MVLCAGTQNQTGQLTLLRRQGRMLGSLIVETSLQLAEHILPLVCHRGPEGAAAAAVCSHELTTSMLTVVCLVLSGRLPYQAFGPALWLLSGGAVVRAEPWSQWQPQHPKASACANAVMSTIQTTDVAPCPADKTSQVWLAWGIHCPTMACTLLPFILVTFAQS